MGIDQIAPVPGQQRDGGIAFSTGLFPHTVDLGTHAFRVLHDVGDLARRAFGEPRRRRGNVARQVRTIVHRRTGRDYSHRRQWMVERIKLLACCFAVEVHAYRIMSNHFHLVVRYDPRACWGWNDEEVARRLVDDGEGQGRRGGTSGC